MIEKKHCFMEFHTRLQRFISGNKLSQICFSGVYGVRPNSTVCCWTFQSPTSRDIPRTEKHVTHWSIRQCADKRFVYYNSSTILQWTGEEHGRRTHRITTFLPVSVKSSASSAFFYLLYKWAPSTATRTTLTSTIGVRRWKCGCGWNSYLSRGYFQVQQLFFNHIVTTVRQLRIISKGGTMGRMNVRQRSYSNKPSSTGKCVRVNIPAVRSKGSQRLPISCSSAYN